MDLHTLLAPDQYNIADEIERHASSKPALVLESADGKKTTVTYSELINQANKLAGSLTRLGLAKGDRVMVMSTRLVESYVIYLACLKAGLVISPSSELLRAKDLAYRLNHSEAKAIVSYAPLTAEFERIEEATPFVQVKMAFGGPVSGWLSMEELMETAADDFQTVQTSKDDLAFLAYTSGTTGLPKGVVHSHGWGYAHLRTAAPGWLNISESDTVWATAAPGWQKWVWSPFLSILGSGATGFLYSGKFSPQKYLQLLQDYRINVLCCTPTEYRMMAKLDSIGTFDLSPLHTAVSAGEALNREVIDVFKRHFNIDIRDGYGQTESTLLIANLNTDMTKTGSMGQPLLPEFIAIVDENARPLPAGETGTIAVRKDFPALFHSYYKDEEKTRSAYAGDYFLTGDRASKDADNYFWFEGRSDDVIISSGYTIGPFEVEDALMKHEAVKECAAVAAPDADRGNVVKAVVVLQDGFAASDELARELQQFVKKLTAPYKYPRIVEFTGALPKTDSGKIRRVALRK